MKGKKQTEKCKAVFDDNECQRNIGHAGKHLDTRDRWVGWTDAGKAAILAEREAIKETKQ